MATEEILEPFELNFSDLLRFSSSPLSDSSSPDCLDSVYDGVMEALGPLGPGLLCVAGVPLDFNLLRQKILPLARKLALLSSGDRDRILKCHGLGSDVPLKNPYRTVSSFAKQFKYADCRDLPKGNSVEDKQVLHDTDFDQLGTAFDRLSYCMMEVGLMLAELCDRKIGGQELKSSLLNSGTGKGRLIHYHSEYDNQIIKKSRERSSKKATKPTPFHTSSHQECERFKTKNQGTERKDIFTSSIRSSSDVWQNWHYDYGIFTVLTAPLFLIPDNMNSLDCTSEWNPPNGLHTCLQLYDRVRRKILMVKASPESFIVQVGETAEILSKGKLRSTLHSVHRPSWWGYLSRENFVVFLQPAWDKFLTMSGRDNSGDHDDDDNELEGDLDKEITKAVPPLRSRLKDGMTFAEFSRVTTRQYYGGGGTQSRK
ncbi:2-oxoglutarate (2OG) and Fe(II)-dependent oxygenase superfamily protein [Wolffia australiana]